MISDYIWALTIDKQDNLWIASSNNGISKFNGKQFENYNTDSGLVGNNAHAVVLENNSTLWIGTFTGLSRLNTKTAVSLKIPTSDYNFLIYPNPANNIIHLKIDDILKKSKVSILTIDGKLMKTTILNSTINEIYLSNFSSGTYVILLSTPKGIINKKIIKL